MTQAPQPTPGTAPNATPTPLQTAWQEAEAALQRFKSSRDPLDRERAVTRLYTVALHEVQKIIKRRVDTKLAPHQRRDPDQMAADAAASVLFHHRKKDDASGLSVLADAFDPEKGDLRALVITILGRKVLDYVRREPIPGLVENRARPGATPTAPTTPATTPPTSPATPLSTAQPSTLGDFAQSLMPDADTGAGSISATGWGAAPVRGPGEAQHVDSHFPPHLLDEFTRHLPADEKEVFLCELAEMTNEEGKDYLNQLHPQREGPDGKLHDYMSLATYKRKLSQARAKLAQIYPDLRP